MWMLKNFLPKNYCMMSAVPDDDLAGSLLDYDPNEEVPSDDGDETPPKKAPEADGDKDDRIAKLEKRVKDSQEFIRQQSETIKDLSDFKERLTGDPEEKKKKRAELERRTRFDEDPLTVMEEMMDERFAKLENRVDLNTTQHSVKDAMRIIEKEYDIDWDKHAEKVVAELENVSEKLRKKDKRKALLKAMNLAGVLKKRDKSSPPYVEGGSGAPIKKQKDDEAQKWKDRVFGKKKKSENVFGI